MTLMRLFILLFFWLLPLAALASGPATRFDRLSIEDGLSQNTVDSIVQDSRGFLWFGTQDGLNRYDGYNFKVFRHDPDDPGSISNNWVEALYLDTKGILWVGTAGGGLDRFDEQTERFVHHQHDAANPNSLSHNIVLSITGDSQGALWVGTYGGGINRFDNVSGQFERFEHNKSNPHSLSNNKVFSIYEDRSGVLWVGTNGGLNRFDRQQQHFDRFNHHPGKSRSLSHDRVNAIYQDNSNTLWVGTDDGLNRFNPQKQQFEVFKHQPSDPYGLSHSNIKDIFQDSRGTLWIGTNGGGLDVYLPQHPPQHQPQHPPQHQHQHQPKKSQQTPRFVHFKHHTADPYSLSHNMLRSIHEDRQGVLWFGTFDGGINKLDNQRQHFGHFKRQASDHNSLSHPSIYAIHKDHEGTLWLGTDGGLNQYRSREQIDGWVNGQLTTPSIGEHGGFNHFKHQPAVPRSISHNSIKTIHQDSNHTLWIGTDGGGLNQYNPVTRDFIHFKHLPTNPGSISHNRIWSMFTDSKGILWVGTYGGGLNKYNRQSQTFTHFMHDADNANSLSNDIIYVIVEDSKGVFWLGTNDGLNRFDSQTEQFTAFKYQPSDSKSLSNNAVNAIHEDADGHLWIGTDGGLNKFDRHQQTFTHYRKKDGLANDTIYGILADSQHQLWISTNKGLSKFDPLKEHFKNYTANDGLQSNEFNQNAYFKASNGELFFGGINGFNRFFAEDIKDNQQLPTVVLTDFLLANQSVAVKPKQKTGQKTEQKAEQAELTEIYTLPKAINALQHLTLSYEQNLISFEFAALHFTNPMKNQYAYRLEGQDKDWVFTGAKKRWATYTNIAPGNYTLLIKASNKDGYWNKQGKSLSITILPPPWKTWWAYLMYAVALSALLLLTVLMLTERRKRANERKVIRQLQQVDKIKDEFLANTSHELRTPLNGIIGLAESLIDGIAGQLPPRANQQLAMVVSSGRRLSNLVNDILDFSKLDNHTLSLNTRPVDLHSLVDVVLALSHHLTDNKNLTLVNQISPELVSAEADEERLQQVLYNLVGNAIKFSEQGHVIVSAELDGERIKMSVSDNGIGIAQDKFDDIFKSFEQVQGSASRRYGGTGLGLAVSKELIALHGSQIEVQSTLNKGSTFSFTLAVSPSDASSAKKVDNSLHRPFDKLHLFGHESHTDAFDLSSNNPDWPTPPTNSNGFRLLLVDDEPINRLVLHNHLSPQGYHLVEACGGEEALLAIEQAALAQGQSDNGQDAPFDLVLLDIMMPKISGYDVCKKIRETYPVNDLPVIFLTAKNQMVDVVQSFAAGANDYLGKPVAKHELLARVETHLKLLDINRTLEHKVAERTLALEQKNHEIVATQQQLVQSEKMASLGTLTAGVAHEINNPTNFVHVSAQNLEVDLARCQKFIFDMAGDDADEAILDSFRRQFNPLHIHLSTIRDGTERIKTIVKDLRAFSQLDAAEKKAVSVTDLLQSTVNLIQTKYLEVTEFVSDFKSRPELECYPAQLNQVFMNLIVNACDAIREQQQIEDTTKLGKITIGCRQWEHVVEISVRDNGSGMSEETKNRLFEPFYTTKGTGSGTGLGLSISFGIVQKHGGELMVESELGVGSVFRVMIPIRQE